MCLYFTLFQFGDRAASLRQIESEAVDLTDRAAQNQREGQLYV